MKVERGRRPRRGWADGARSGAVSWWPGLWYAPPREREWARARRRRAWARERERFCDGAPARACRSLPLAPTPALRGPLSPISIHPHPGSELVDTLHPSPGEHVISKKRFSAFWGTHAASLLRRLGVGHVVLAGVQTPNCIRATAFDALAEDFPAVTVLADATASASEQVQAANLADLRAVGVHTPTLAEWLASTAHARGLSSWWPRWSGGSVAQDAAGAPAASP